MRFGPIDLHHPVFEVLGILALYAAFAGAAVLALVYSAARS